MNVQRLGRRPGLLAVASGLLLLFAAYAGMAELSSPVESVVVGFGVGFFLVATAVLLYLVGKERRESRRA